MSEENTQEAVVDETQVEGEVSEVKAEEIPAGPSAVEIKAIEMGWRPKEEFEGDEGDFIDAQEFVRRKPLFEKIDHVGRELKETRKALKALQDHHQKVKEAEYQNALKQLKAEKKAALEEGDADRLIEIDDRIANAKAEEVAQRVQQTQAASQPHPNFVSWVEKNQWYRENAELKSVADQIGTGYASSNPEAHPDDVLKYVEGRIKKLYPENFKNPNKERPSAVEGGTSTPASKKSDIDDLNNYPLSEDERRVMMTFVRQGIMTKEQYIKDLKMVKEQ